MAAYDYGKQYYLTKGYESIWERSSQDIYKSLKSWETTVDPEDLVLIREEMENRSVNKAKGFCAYKIRLPNGESKFIKNIAHTFNDTNGNPLFIAGIDESVNQVQWEKWKLNIKENTALKSADILAGFQKIIEKEMHGSIIAPSNNVVLFSDPKKRTINIKGMEVRLSKRESEALDYLKQGFSAKQTAYEMQISVRTVECYLENLRKKTHCRTKIALVGCLH